MPIAFDTHKALSLSLVSSTICATRNSHNMFAPLHETPMRPIGAKIPGSVKLVRQQRMWLVGWRPRNGADVPRIRKQRTYFVDSEARDAYVDYLD
ncbi:hypothetical protein P280DRAFT_474680 [Massarina eburnea CBS 473.64]|uniref:Uncharacterized protein n=1 Tax=Massarina eburnea CBS 473.64 TaxID=1395130 RepID=A0A6A6RG02_9PLEO|nr:hypothetical protein P280DRAFT_474680 [Massarina eburnea CBS 473.64]